MTPIEEQYRGGGGGGGGGYFFYSFQISNSQFLLDSMLKMSKNCLLQLLDPITFEPSLNWKNYSSKIYPKCYNHSMQSFC